VSLAKATAAVTRGMSYRETLKTMDAASKNVSKIRLPDISIGILVVVDLTPKNKTAAIKKRNFYLGKIKAILPDAEFEATFLRPTFRSDGSAFSFPQVEDRSIFYFDQLVGKVESPQELRRRALQFRVNSKNW